MKNDTFSSTLRRMRAQSGLSVKEVIELLKLDGQDISSKTLYSYESGKRMPSGDMLISLCKIYKCKNILREFDEDTSNVIFTNADWELLEKYHYIDDLGRDSVDHILKNEYDRKKQTEQQQKNQEKEAELQALKEESDDQPDLYARRIRRGGIANNAPPIPQKGHKMTKLNHFEGAYGAGGGQTNDNATMVTIEVSEEDVPEGADTTINIAGDSMEPTLSNKDVVYVQHTNQLEIGDIGVFYLDGQNFIKEYGGDELISHNPEYAPIQISEFSTFVIQGKVLGKKIEGFVEL